MSDRPYNCGMCMVPQESIGLCAVCVQIENLRQRVFALEAQRTERAARADRTVSDLRAICLTLETANNALVERINALEEINRKWICKNAEIGKQNYEGAHALLKTMHDLINKTVTGTTTEPEQPKDVAQVVCPTCRREHNLFCSDAFHVKPNASAASTDKAKSAAQAELDKAKDEPTPPHKVRMITRVSSRNEIMIEPTATASELRLVLEATLKSECALRAELDKASETIEDLRDEVKDSEDARANIAESHVPLRQRIKDLEAQNAKLTEELEHHVDRNTKYIEKLTEERDKLRKFWELFRYHDNAYSACIYSHSMYELTWKEAGGV